MDKLGEDIHGEPVKIDLLDRREMVRAEADDIDI
jgi:hypothetical protein